MTLDDTQTAKIKEWISEGAELAEIQTRLFDEFAIQMTYMEVRFLVDDLGVVPKDKERPKDPAADTVSQDAEPMPAEGNSAPPQEIGASNDANPADGMLGDGAGVGGGVSVTVDQLARPGTIVSGKVTFSDGKSAEWSLDQLGRLGLAPQEEGYKPSQQDLMEFQVQLQKQMGRMGF